VSDELDRLTAADPHPGAPAAVPAPIPAGPPGRARHTPRRVAGALGLLALGGLVAALIVATPSGDDEPAPAVEPLVVSLLERPGPAAAVRPLPAAIDPSSVREAARAAGILWFAARRTGSRGEACILSLGVDDRVVLHRCAPVAGGLVAGVRRDGRRFRVGGIVPDGITTVTVGARAVPVRDNAFAMTTATRPDVVILQGPAAPRIPRRPDVAVATPSPGPPAVAVAFDPAPRRASGLPAPVRGTLREAAAAAPFTVLAPDPPPLGGEVWVSWSPRDPRMFPQVLIDYLPERTGHGISLIEGAVRGRSPRDGERTVVRDGRAIYVLHASDPLLRRVRTVVDGTDVQVSGQDATLDDLLAVAASLRPVAP